MTIHSRHGVNLSQWKNKNSDRGPLKIVAHSRMTHKTRERSEKKTQPVKPRQAKY